MCFPGEFPFYYFLFFNDFIRTLLCYHLVFLSEYLCMFFKQLLFVTLPLHSNYDSHKIEFSKTGEQADMLHPAELQAIFHDCTYIVLIMMNPNDF